MKHFFPLILAAAMFTGCESGSQSAKPDEAAENAAYESILTRTSIRKYVPGKEIAPDTVEMILRAGMAAPTAMNKQPWQFVVLNDRPSIDSLTQFLPYAKMLEEAPLAIVPCADLSEAINGETAEKGFWIQDLSASSENILLAAHALGLGAVWTGVYPSEERVKAVQQALGLPQEIVPLCVIPVGYPAQDPTPKDKWKPEKIHYNHW